MRSLVLFGVLCAAAVTAGNYIPVYGEQYVRPGLQYPYVTIPSYRQYPYRHYPYGVLPQHGLPLASAPVSGVATAAPTVSALPLAPVAPAAVPSRPLAPGAPGGSVIFSGNRDVSDAGTGVGFFAGRGEVDLAGDFPAGDFIGDEQAQFDGASQIQVSTVPSFSALSGLAGFILNGVGETLFNTNTLRGGRSYDVPAVSTHGSVHPSYGYSTHGSVYPSYGYFPGSYGTYRLIRPAPVAGTYGTTYGPVYGKVNTYAPKYYY